MKQHIAKVATACFYHIRHLRQIRRRAGQAVSARLVLTMITSRLDCCNSVPAGLCQHCLHLNHYIKSRIAQHTSSLTCVIMITSRHL